MSTPKKKKNMKPRSERYTLSNHVANFFLAAAFAIFPLFVNLTFDGNFPFIHFDKADGHRIGIGILVDHRTARIQILRQVAVLIGAVNRVLGSPQHGALR